MDTTSPSQLRSFGALFSTAWKTFNQYFPTLFGISLIGLIPQILLNLPTTEDSPINALMLIFGIASIFLGFWMSATIYFYLVKKPAEKNPLKIYGLALQYLWRFFTTGLIEGLIYVAIAFAIAIPSFFMLGFSAASLLGSNAATTLFENAGAIIVGWIIVMFVAIIPIIYLSIRWQFASLLVITDGIANFTALRQSTQLVKRRWWSVFGRMFLFGISMLGYLIVVGIITGLFGDNMVAWGLQTLLTGLVTGPLLICFELELFSDLRQSAQPQQTAATPPPMVTT